MIIRSLNKINYRGPDDSKIIIDEKDDFLICFGFCRLSILDLSNESMQPILNKSKISVFNGEIYNYNKINNKNYSSDTLFLKENLKNEKISYFLPQLKGMFSIVSLDLENNELTFATDYFGQKPLYYSYKDNAIFFSSQIVSLLEFDFIPKEINQEGIKKYLEFNFFSKKETIFKKINYHEPNTLTIFDIRNSKIIKRIEKKNKILNKKITLKKNITDEFHNIFLNVMDLHLNTDVKTCSLLSSGIDSSTISLYANLINQKHETFTINFKEKEISEINNVNKFIRKTGIINHIIKPDKNDIINFIENITDVYDQPFSDSSQINQYIIFKKIRENGFKCSLSGDGGDEIFGGYNRYKYYKKVNFIKYFLFLNKKSKEIILSLISKKNIYLTNHLIKIMNITNFKNVKEYYFTLINNNLKYNSSLIPNFDFDLKNDERDILNYDKDFYLPYDILTKIDRASMYNSVENRSPFLYEDIEIFAKSIEGTNFFKKNILYNNLFKKFKIKIPKMKKGFAFSIENELLRNTAYTDYFIDILRFGEKYFLNLIGENDFKDILKKFINGDNTHNFIIWNRVVLILWLKKYI